MVDAFSQRYQTVSACVSLLTFSLNLVLWLTCFDLTISHYNFIFSLLCCLKCCESLVKLSDVGEFCSPKLCLDDQQTGAEAQLPPLHKSSPNLFFDQLPSQQDQAACKQWKYWNFLAEKMFFTLASVLWMATLSCRHFLTISCWPLDSSCSNKWGKVQKSGNAISLIDLEFIDQFEFWTTRFFDILQIGECQRLRKNFLLHWFWWHFHSRLTIPILCAVHNILW